MTTATKPQAKKRRRTPYKQPDIDFCFSQRPDGLYNFWQYRYVKGYSYGIDNPVWVLKGVYESIPRWALTEMYKKGSVTIKGETNV